MTGCIMDGCDMQWWGTQRAAAVNSEKTAGEKLKGGDSRTVSKQGRCRQGTGISGREQQRRKTKDFFGSNRVHANPATPAGTASAKANLQEVASRGGGGVT